MKTPKYNRDYFLSIIKEHNLKYMRELKHNFPHLDLYYTRHRIRIGALPLLRSKNNNNYWTKERCLQEALKYAHRSDFQSHSKAAYCRAVKSGWVDEICKHTIPKLYEHSRHNKGMPATTRLDLTGKVFNGWTVLKYSHTKNKIAYWVCKCKCGRVDTVNGRNVRRGLSQSCTRCSKQISKASISIHKFIISLGFVDAVLGDRSMGKELDVYVPSKKFAVGLDGIRWHSEMFRTTEQKELERYKWFQDRGISCLRIFDDEFKKSEQLVYRMIKARLLPQDKTKVDYNIKFIPNPSQYKQFFESHHLDGYVNSKFAFGAFDTDNNLISCASFRHYMQGKYKHQLELARFCSDSTKPTYGCFGKLMKVAKSYAKSKGYTHLLSASDNRLGNGSVYENNGFTKAHEPKTRLNYYYYVPSQNIRLHRANCKKIHPPKISDGVYKAFSTQSAQNEAGLFGLLRYGVHEKFYRVWGWGNKLWILSLNKGR